MANRYRDTNVGQEGSSSDHIINFEDGSHPQLDQNVDHADETDDTDVREVNKDYDCYCFGTKIINTSPRIVIMFIISILVVVFSFVFMFIKGDVVIFAPIISLVVGFWLPSPTQSAQSRKDALQNARLLQNNMRMNRLMVRYGIVKRPDGV